MHFTSAEISGLVGSYFWPFVRIAALVTATPAFSSVFMPIRVRLIMALALTLIIAPVIPPVPSVDALSGLGLMIILQQVLIGLTMGFALHLVFSAFVIGGQIIAMQMGLGFASMIDPQSGSQAPVLSMFYVLLVTLFFFGMDGHLALIGIIAQSFDTLPIGPLGVDSDGLWRLVTWGTEMFSGAVLVALPAITALLVVNMSLGVMGRAAPQLNIFAVGFAITIVSGFYAILLSLPSTATRFEHLMVDGFSVTRFLAGM